MKTYEDYSTGPNASDAKKDYYTALSDSLNVPNSSVGTIIADKTRINFDLDVTLKCNHLKRLGSANYLTQ